MPHFYPNEIREFVANSAKLLDNDRPNWHNQINLDHLNMQDHRHCIVGQLDLHGVNPDFGKHVSINDIAFSYTRGFFLPNNCSIDCLGDAEDIDGNYLFLTQLWKAEIQRRIDNN